MYRTLLKWSYRTCFAGNRREDRKEPPSPPRSPARIADVWVRPHTSDPHVSEVAVLQASHFHPPRSPPSPSRSRLVSSLRGGNAGVNAKDGGKPTRPRLLCPLALSHWQLPHDADKTEPATAAGQPGPPCRQRLRLFLYHNYNTVTHSFREKNLI